MKTNRAFLAALFFIFSSFCYLGCNKTDHPFGIYSPNGLDVPTATATPLAGAINVFVVENNVAVSGVTVNLKDPNGNYLGNIVTGSGAGAYAPFSPFPVTTGIWQAEVYTQGHYLDATQSFVVSGGQTSVTFTAGVVGTTSPVITSGPLNQQYQTGNGNFGYGVTYTQPGNLSIPVSVELSNVLPTGFSSSPATFVLGLNGTILDQSNVTISKTACNTSNVPVTFSAFDFFGSKIWNSTSFSVTRGFQIPLSVSINGTATTTVPPGQKTNVSFSLNLSTSNDCNYSYPINVWAVALGNFNTPTTIFSNNLLLLNGGSASGSFQVGGDQHTTTHIYVTVTSPGGKSSGSVVTNSTFNSVALTTSY